MTLNHTLDFDLMLSEIRRRYPDPESDQDSEPHEWADGILGEWANGATIPIRAHDGNVIQAALADMSRIYAEWSERGDWIRRLADVAEREVSRLRVEKT